ncbi:putative membrane protein, partial [Ehrlichia ruminantium]
MKYKSKELDISDNGTKSRVTYCSQSEYEYGKCEMDTSSGKDGIEFLKSVYHNDSDDVGHVLKSRSTVSSTKVDQVKHQVSSVQT